jgi:iron complex outermembrane receptor protein
MQSNTTHLKAWRGLASNGLALAITFCSHTASASPDASATDASSALQEVVVTANKRSENSKDVPVSIGVVDAAEIADLHIEGYEDISRLVPGVSFAAHNGPGQDNISIRGLSSTIGNPTVGLYIDEVPIITNNGYDGAAEPKIIDIDRVEILRGPQGTLYGASSEGGTIRFITNQPDARQFGFSTRTELSGTKHGGFNYDEQGVVNLPIVEDIFALRIAGEYGQTSGYIDHYDLNGALNRKGVNSETDAVVHVTGKLDLTDLTVLPSFFYQRISAADSPTFIPALGLYKQNKQVIEFDRDTLMIPSVTVKKGFAFADLTSVSSYVKRAIDRQADGTYFNSAAIAQFFLDPAYPAFQPQNDSILANVASPVLFTDRFNTLTQELRLTSPSDQKRVKWVAGLFLSDQEWSHLDYEVAPGFSAAFQKIYGHSIVNDPVLDPAGDPTLWANDLVWTVFDHNDIKQYAIFGQVDFDITPTLHAGVGERYVWAKEKFTETGGGFLDLGGAGVPGTPTYVQSASFSASTPKFSLTYDLTTNATVYATAGKGFRLGGATTPNVNVACLEGLKQLGYNNAPLSYGSDQLWSYELGSKSLLFSKTLSIDADVYYINWQRIQQTIIIPICGGQFNANVGDAKAFGTELSVRYKPPVISGLTLSLNVGAEHAYITSTINSSTAAVGEDVLYTPKWTTSVVTDYGWRLTDAVGAFVRGDYEYIGESKGSFQVTSSQYIDPSYSVVNLNAGLKFGSFEVALFAKNLFDNKTILQSPQINSVIEGYTLRPVTVGISLSKKM